MRFAIPPNEEIYICDLYKILNQGCKEMAIGDDSAYLNVMILCACAVKLVKEFVLLAYIYSQAGHRKRNTNTQLGLHMLEFGSLEPS